MAQLWGGRFTKQTDEAVKAFNDSIGFDKRLYKEDIEGSIAHAQMLGAQGIITEEEAGLITAELARILADVESGALPITGEYEDIHSFVEANLIDRIGDAGKKLHTGRSRNDQVALDMKLYTRRKTREIREELGTLLDTILRLMEPTPICPDSPICRRRSPPRWPITWAPISRCSEGMRGDSTTAWRE